MDLTDAQRRRLTVLRHYHAYVGALHDAHLDSSAASVRSSRRALAEAIEEACAHDPWLLSDFKRAFAAQGPK